MRIKVVERYEAAIIELKGNVMGGPAAGALSETLRGLLAAGKKNIVLDLAGVKFMNSSGLGMLISGFTSVKKEEGSLVLANVTEKIESLLMITKLITIFEHFETVDDAVKSFSK